MNDRLMEPALFVKDINVEMDLSLPPTSGEDYIRRVVIEARRCDSVVVAEIAESKLTKPTVSVNTLSGCVEAPVSVRPSLEWQQHQIADFSDVRLKIAGWRSQTLKENYRWKRSTVSLPDVDDQSGWINFCSASMESSSSSMSSPTLGVIFSMSHPTVEQVLEYLIEHVETEGKLASNLGQWIYALLAVLELPLNPDICSCLRTLARTCSIIRTRTDPAQDEEVNTLNLFICLVARYFRQLDLADP